MRKSARQVLMARSEIRLRDWQNIHMIIEPVYRLSVARSVSSIGQELYLRQSAMGRSHKMFGKCAHKDRCFLRIGKT